MNKTLSKAIKEKLDKSGPMTNKHEYLEDIFKFYVADFWIYVKEISEKNKTELTVDTLTESKRTLVDEFRNIEGIPEYQLSVEKYEQLFETTVQEILNEAAHAHEGSDSYKMDQTLSIDKDGYADQNNYVKNSDGLYVPNS